MARDKDRGCTVVMRAVVIEMGGAAGDDVREELHCRHAPHVFVT